MRKLTERGICLKNALEASNLIVIEAYPCGRHNMRLLREFVFGRKNSRVRRTQSYNSDAKRCVSKNQSWLIRDINLD